MSTMKTPGVYIVEKNAFPNSVVEVATAVPAFIGYTEKAANGNKSLLNKPWRITSMAEFRSYFGEAPKPGFELAEGAGSSAINFNGKSYLLQRTDSYILYYSMLLFYANGGGP
ncbi:MAG: phage tail sheath family protein, partial [Prevotella sp.]|nr:phage tail sheath family protein [Prevotella sp.]